MSDRSLASVAFVSAVTRPRGPLPPRVYWTRRLILVGVTLGLVVVLARLFGGGADGEDATARAASGEAASAAADDSSDGSGNSSGDDGSTEPEAEGGQDADEPAEGETEAAEPTSEPPAQPDGECATDDVVITPRIENAVAGSPVDIVLSVTTRESAACYWTVSAQSVVVKVTSGSDDIWSSQHCPDAVVAADLVVRHDTPADTTVQWPAWRSGADCTIEQWSMPGYYHVEAAPLAGEPTQAQFELVAPEPEVVERTAEPSATP